MPEPKQTRLALLPWLILLIGLASCLRETSPEEDPREDILKSQGEGAILPGYERFTRESEALAAASDAFCNAPEDEALLLSTRDAWEKARYAYKRMEVFAFGPHVAYPERFGPNIDFWPARETTIEETLLSEDDLDAASLGTSGASRRGLPVIEYLLWSAGDDTLAAFAENPRRCTYLVAASGDLANLARGFEDAWSREGGNFLDELVAPASVEDGMYMNTQEAMSEVVNRMGFTLENIRRDKLGRPLGDETGGEPQPHKVESYWSGHSIEDIEANLEMIELLFHGDESARGLASHPRLQGRPDLVAAFDGKLAAARDALDEIEAPLSKAVLEEPDRVRSAHEALGELQTLIQADVVGLLSLTPSFNDSDGD